MMCSTCLVSYFLPLILSLFQLRGTLHSIFILFHEDCSCLFCLLVCLFFQPGHNDAGLVVQVAGRGIPLGRCFLHIILYSGLTSCM